MADLLSKRELHQVLDYCMLDNPMGQQIQEEEYEDAE